MLSCRGLVRVGVSEIGHGPDSVPRLFAGLRFMMCTIRKVHLYSLVLGHHKSSVKVKKASKDDIFYPSLPTYLLANLDEVALFGQLDVAVLFVSKSN